MARSRRYALPLLLAAAFAVGVLLRSFAGSSPEDPPESPRRRLPQHPRPAPVQPTEPPPSPTAEAEAGPRGPGEMAGPRFHPRAPEEWQGMLVDLSMQARCGPGDACGLAMACHGTRCGPCSTDRDCESGEICVLDHCLHEEQAECRSRTDCDDGELCLLSGYSSDLRGNRELTSRCLAAEGGQARETTNPAGSSEYNLPAPARLVPMEDLLEEARELLPPPSPPSL